MGIKNLNKFLKKNCPNIYKEIHISEYSYKLLSIDISLYMFKYKAIYGDRWLDAFINLVTCFRKNEIHCVFIYDNGSPPEKQKEKEERSLQKRKLEERVEKLDIEINNFHLTQEITDYLRDYFDKLTKEKVVRLLKPDSKSIFNISILEKELKKIQSQIVNVSQNDFQLTKDIFNILGIPYFIAPLEAETMCAHMCISNLCDGVVSEDTDVLAYNTPKFLTKLNTGNSTCIEISVEDILKELEITYEQFRDLCIMCGTDYNSNIFKIGPEKAFKLIKTHSSIENIAENTDIDISILNHVRCRELFSLENNLEISVPFCKDPNWSDLSKFLFENNCNVTLDYIKECFAPKELIFE